eukprot:COSAG02_NODE_1200_length_13909_cov_15.541202_9_plen_119_part_00
MSQLHRTGSFAVSLVVRGPSDPTLASTAAAAAGVAPPSSAEAYSDSCMVLACPVLQMQCTLRVHLPLSAPRARSHAGAALAPALPAVDRAARSNEWSSRCAADGNFLPARVRVRRTRT